MKSRGSSEGKPLTDKSLSIFNYQPFLCTTIVIDLGVFQFIGSSFKGSYCTVLEFELLNLELSWVIPMVPLPESYACKGGQQQFLSDATG